MNFNDVYKKLALMESDEHSPSAILRRIESNYDLSDDMTAYDAIEDWLQSHGLEHMYDKVVDEFENGHGVDESSCGCGNDPCDCQKKVSEDFGSSDWSPIIADMDSQIKSLGITPENIEGVADALANDYYEEMGYDAPEQAANSIVSMWLRRSETGKKLNDFFSPPVTEDWRSSDMKKAVSELEGHIRKQYHGNFEMPVVRKAARDLAAKYADAMEYSEEDAAQRLVFALSLKKWHGQAKREPNYDMALEQTNEGEERPYVCVHARKGKHECTASSSYEAAKKAADHWKLKSTAGVDAYLSDVTHQPQHVTDSKMNNKNKINEAQINLSITDLNSEDAEALSQLLHIAGVAEKSAAPELGGMPGDLPPDPIDVPMDPMAGDTLGMDDMGDFDTEMPEPDMDPAPDLDSDDYDGGFDAAMDMDDVDQGMEIEPSDDVDVDMTPDDEAVIMQDDFAINDLLALSGMDILPEEDEDHMWDNEPDPESADDYSDIPSGGPNMKKSKRAGAPEAVKVVERADALRRKLNRVKGITEAEMTDKQKEFFGKKNDKADDSNKDDADDSDKENIKEFFTKEYFDKKKKDDKKKNDDVDDSEKDDDKDDVAESQYRNTLAIMKAAVARK